MQADFVLFLRSASVPGTGRWYPFSLVYRNHRPFELFARAESRAYFSRLTGVLGVPTVEALKQKMSELGDRVERMFEYRGLAVSAMANSEHLGTIP